jgi:hypothetical protein
MFAAFSPRAPACGQHPERHFENNNYNDEKIKLIVFGYTINKLK